MYACEARPLLQGARLTTWELLQRRIPATLICDSMAAQVMREGRVQLVVTGADRIAANGDVANKIGTYSAAVAARHHGVKFMVVAPSSTVDMNISAGADIPIEARPPAEVLEVAGVVVAAEGARAWNPAFDVTPNELVSAIITDNGIARSPYQSSLAKAVETE